MSKRKHTSCKYCLWNWVAPIGLAPKHCYNRQSPKLHKTAVGGCSKFEAPAPDSENYIPYQYPNGLPKKKKKKKETATNAQAG